MLMLETSNAQVSNLEPIKRLTNLKSLNLQNCENITDELVEEL
jgi:hypothetical protein